MDSERIQPSVYHVTDVFSPSIGGIETALDTLLPRLRGVKSVVLVDSSNRPAVSPPTSKVEVIEITGRRGGWKAILSPPINSFLERRSAALISLLANLAKEDERMKIIKASSGRSLLHFHGLGWLRRFDPATPGVRGLLNNMVFHRFFRNSRYSATRIYTDHSLFSGDYNRFLANAGPSLLTHAGAIVTVERSGFDNANRWLKERGLHIMVRLIPNPVDLARFSWQPPRSGSNFTLGYVGRASKPGLRVIAAMWDQAPPWANLTLCLAGDRGSLSNLDPSVSRLLGNPAVRTSWNITQAQMPSFLASLDVLLDPFEVGTPRTTIEAFAVGRPVFRFRPSPEDAESLVPADVAPVFLDTSPTSAWTLAEQWYRAREAYYRVCRRTREFAVATFDANRIAEQYSVLYQELLGQG